jgi:1-phosphatidylinositol-4-phosphate 5-kinase
LDISKSILEEGQYVNGLKEGFGRSIYPGGDYYEGQWKLGLQDGHGKFTFPNGITYIGSYK